MPPRIDLGMDPIQQKHRENMQAVMKGLEDVFPGTGLCLFLFDKDASGPRANYISNARREQTLEAIKEWVLRQSAFAS
jgi:hypothetical protein